MPSQLKITAHTALALLLISCFHGLSSAQGGVSFTAPNSYLQVANDTELQLETFTLECWIMPLPGGEALPTPLPGTAIEPIISRGIYRTEGTSEYNYFLGLREDRTLFFGFGSATMGAEPIGSYHLSGFTPLVDSAWHHVALTFDGKTLTLFLNGKPEAMLEALPFPDIHVSAILGIGCTFNALSQPMGSFNGKMDALRIWDIPLSHAEILDRMNSEQMDLPNLVLGMQFNEESGSLFDVAGRVSADQLIAHNSIRTEGAHFRNMIPPLIDTDVLLRLGLISDPQYCDCEAPPGSSRHYRESLNKLPVAIGTLNALNIDLAITLGDVIDREYSSYDSILPLYQALDADHYFVLGNHEFDIENSLKQYVPDRLNLPANFFSISRDGWRFLFLDGTELAEYTRVLHPELTEESDSLIRAVAGKVYDKPWNGGISRDQQHWMREQIELAGTNRELVILFCHFPLLPDSVHLNLWNQNTLIDLLTDYEHVVAYINGHNHYGGYDFRNAIHYLTHYGMVETADSNSFSMLEIHPGSLQLKGYGYNTDRRLNYHDPFKTLSPPRLIDDQLHYFQDSADFVSCIVSPDMGNDSVNFYLIGDTADSDNILFHIRNDSLFLNANPDYLSLQTYSIRLGMINYLFDTVSILAEMHLDTCFAVQRFNLQDTSLSVDETYTIFLDSLFHDYSRYGLEINCYISDRDVAYHSLNDSVLRFHALAYGITSIVTEAYDPYTGRSLRDTLMLSVTDPWNLPPIHRDPDPQVIPWQDTLVVLLDTLFSDPDADSLIYRIQYVIDPLMHCIILGNSRFISHTDSGTSGEIALTANDGRGGTDTLVLSVKFNTPPVKIGTFTEAELGLYSSPLEIVLDTLYIDPDDDSLFYTFTLSSHAVGGSLVGNLLIMEPRQTGTVQVHLWIDDRYGGVLHDTLAIEVTDASNLQPPASPTESWELFPNPAGNFITLQSGRTEGGYYHIKLCNPLGQILTSLELELSSEERPIVHIPLEHLPDGAYFLSISGSAKNTCLLSFNKISP